MCRAPRSAGVSYGVSSFCNSVRGLARGRGMGMHGNPRQHGGVFALLRLGASGCLTPEYRFRVALLTSS